MLLNLYKNNWNAGLKHDNFKEHASMNEVDMKEMVKLATEYSKLIEDETKKGEKETKIKNVGKLDPKRHM